MTEQGAIVLKYKKTKFFLGKPKEFLEARKNHSPDSNFQDKTDKRDESMEVFKENISIGYLNNSVKHKKSSSFNQSSSITSKNRIPIDKNLDMKNSLINQSHLKTYLKTNKSFPEKNRIFLWKSLLQLPENKEAFNNLLRRGIEPKFQDLYKKYQLSSENIFRKLQRLLSAFCFYSPAFLNVPFLQDMIFPFIKLFGNNELLSFEVILSFFLNWGQHFFEYAPNPPINYFKYVNEIIMNEDKEFWDFLQERKVSSIYLIWPSFQVLFTDILQKDEWLSLMDFLILNHKKPEFLIYFSAILILSYKSKIMKNEDDILTLDSYERNWTIDKIISSIEKLEFKLPFSFSSLIFKSNLPLIQDQYPIHNFYPLYDLDDHRKLREKIIEDEEKYAEEKKRVTLTKIQSISNDLINGQNQLKRGWLDFTRKVEDEKELVKIEQEMVLKKKTDFEDKKIFENIVKLEQMENDFKRTLQEQIDGREQEKLALEHELEFKKKIEDMRLGGKLKDESLNNQNFQLLMKMNDLIKQREKQEEERDSKQKMKLYETKQFYEDCITKEKLSKEKSLFLLKKDLELKKQMVEENMREELLKKKTMNDGFLIDQIKNDLAKTFDNNMREIQQETDKEKMMTNQFSELMKKIEFSPQGKNKRGEGLIRQNRGSFGNWEEDGEMESLKNDLRNQMSQGRLNLN